MLTVVIRSSILKEGEYDIKITNAFTGENTLAEDILKVIWYPEVYDIYPSVAQENTIAELLISGYRLKLGNEDSVDGIYKITIAGVEAENLEWVDLEDIPEDTQDLVGIKCRLDTSKLEPNKVYDILT